MRLSSLVLTRYGKFTDRRIDFGPARPGRPDLHVVYGPNEAGKSTMLSAFLDLLYGIETRSRFNFIHPYPAMQVGGRLELAAGPRELQRVKRSQNTLLDGAGEALDERLVLTDLAGIDRDAYRTMFSLDDDTLELGGKSILASRGDLGQLLFAASAGLSGLTEALAAVQGDAEGFYRKGARSGELATLKARLLDLKTRREALDTAAATYRQLVQSRDEADAAYGAVLAGHGQAKGLQAEIGRLLAALPLRSELGRLDAELGALDGLPAARPDWREALPALQTEATAHATRLSGLRSEIAELTAEIEASPVDDAADGIAGRFADLSGLEKRFGSAEDDLPKRRLSAGELGTKIAGILGRLGREGEAEPRRLLLGAASTGALRSLMETHSGVEGAFERAREERDLASERLGAVSRRLEAACASAGSREPMEPTAALRLATAISVAKAGNHATLRQVAERELAKAVDAVEDGLKALLPWRGDPAALEALALPVPGDVARWTEALDAAARRFERDDEAIEAARGRIAEVEAERESLSSELGLAGEESVAAIRAARKAAWTLHRAALDAPSADTFAALLDREEASTDARLAQAGLAARLREAERVGARARAELSEASRRREDGVSRLAAITADIDAALGTLRRDIPGATPAFLEDFLPKRQRVLQALQALRRAERDRLSAMREENAERERLAAALAAAGVRADPEAGLDELVAAAEARRSADATLLALTEDADAAARDFARREEDFDRAKAARTTWDAAWITACSASWLGDGDFVPSLGAVREVLSALEALAALLGEQDGLAERIAKMEEDQAAFCTAVASLAEAIGESSAGRSATALAATVRARIAEAEFARKRRSDLEGRLRRAEVRLREAAAAEATLQARAAEMTGYFGVETLGDAAVAMARADRRAELIERRDAVEWSLLESTRAATLDAANEALDGVDRPVLEAELGAVEARLTDEESRLRELHTRMARAEERIEEIGGDDAVARIEAERRTVLLEIEDGAMRSLRLRAGAMAAARALALYRDQHRSSMLRRASEAFRSVTAGAYRGLAAQPDKDGEVIVALAADGGSRLPAELSKGTCFQLYLSLRLAGYGEFAAARPSVPFIADDIMETFDDGRAEETFRLFGDMALVGQVIYLTHHRHLCEMARRVCPDMVLHHLDGQAAERPAA